MILNYFLLVTGPAYGTQHSSTAYKFSLALLAKGHKIHSIFFYHDGVLNANQLSTPATDEFDLVRAWKKLSDQHGIALSVCVSAAFRRGIINVQEAQKHGLPVANLQSGFSLGGLGMFAEALMNCDRVVQF